MQRKEERRKIERAVDDVVKERVGKKEDSEGVSREKELDRRVK